ncbi:hypothetical protein HJFPF1_09139 [Paramyrothecium foliicola]|nr:hypothetical protein HJFPF1_09139 [Paramyrothecium foliicola]
MGQKRFWSKDEEGTGKASERAEREMEGKWLWQTQSGHGVRSRPDPDADGASSKSLGGGGFRTWLGAWWMLMSGVGRGIQIGGRGVAKER